MLHDSFLQRAKTLNNQPDTDGDHVLYWMQASQRAKANHALEFAVQIANERSLRLMVLFVLTPTFPEANLRSYAFMIQGLTEIQSALADRGIPFIMQVGNPTQMVPTAAKNSAILITDSGYLRIQKQWRRQIAETVKCPMVQVATDVVVPVEKVSDKEEPSAATIRRKIHGLLPGFLTPIEETELIRDSLGLKQLDSVKLSLDLLDEFPIDRSVAPVPDFIGGEQAGEQLLQRFIDINLHRYHDLRNDPAVDRQSNLSPYLHFGQLSPVHIIHRIMNASAPDEAKTAFIEQLVVRRELSFNFVHYNEFYDSYDCIPNWAKAAFSRHEKDPRPAIYELEDLENARTHDPYWNAAMKEMKLTGKMHGYMRMYWGKKVIEWSRTPATAYKTLMHLNNKYFLDGRDPNSYAGVAWCFGKHDRPFSERSVFGNVRYMNSAGLERKFDIGAYVQRITKLEKE